MKVLLVNGSPHAKGCTFTALSEVASALEKNGVETEIFQLGLKPIAGCRGCGHCAQTGKCVIDTDVVNPFIAQIDQYDGFVFGSPVHYASGSGAITSFMDRAFFAAGGKMAYKPGAVVVSCRRAGSTAALDQLMKYMTLSQMPVVTSQYWNMVHGAEAGEVLQDVEGVQTMRVLGRNMAWLLRCIEAGKAAGIAFPEKEERAWTNFIR
ncbi:flavodoxin family protein [Parabacteroides sp. PF5-6]|uniref:flavodoxin family protein n=1 Tax=Parabacteroides sp. PF5-6 TaxID=1742403 RepID=UPI0024053CE2|nr:flavodoxin family protein [Parabacteroides sp. PF5-6]MDF9829002.1 multimeric flavodoxin WrbA [Parabacteroides sp. PF5-6]